LNEKLKVILTGFGICATILQISWTIQAISATKRTVKAEERIADALESRNG